MVSEKIKKSSSGSQKAVYIRKAKCLYSLEEGETIPWKSKQGMKLSDAKTNEANRHMPAVTKKASVAIWAAVEES